MSTQPWYMTEESLNQYYNAETGTWICAATTAEAVAINFLQCLLDEPGTDPFFANYGFFAAPVLKNYWPLQYAAQNPVRQFAESEYITQITYTIDNDKKILNYIVEMSEPIFGQVGENANIMPVLQKVSQ